MNILITGHSAGLGKALMRVLKLNGHSVYGISRSASGEVENECICNFSDLGIARKIIPQYLAAIPNLDYVILNAGMLGDITHCRKLSVEQIDYVMRVNVYSNKITIDALLQREAHCKTIIGISSGAALAPKFGWLQYCLTKGAFKMLIETYACEESSIKFLSVAPGIIKTRMQEKILKVDANEIPSVKKFHDMYPNMDTAEVIAKHVFEFLFTCENYESGDFVDLRNIGKLPTVDGYLNKIQ